MFCLSNTSINKFLALQVLLIISSAHEEWVCNGRRSKPSFFPPAFLKSEK
jgi:hypothetical protein